MLPGGVKSHLAELQSRSPAADTPASGMGPLPSLPDDRGFSVFDIRRYA